ncbi:unnamed protein product [Ectocarpus sp. CCAP 1310/34]|nr:unnamed protein product [Ectocarpus sp. CCAP 1310/34]
MVFASMLASVSFLLLCPQLWHLSVAFVVVYPPSDHGRASHRWLFSERAAAAALQWARAPTTAVHADSPGRTQGSRCRCHPPSFDSSSISISSSSSSRERRASEGRVVGGAGRGRRTRRRSRQRLLQARPGNEVDPPEREVIDAEFSDDFSRIVEADRASKRKKPREEKPAPRKKPVKTAAAKKSTASAPAPAPAPFTFAGSGFASLEEALASGEFADLSGGRGSCLKRVDEDGFETDGNPPKGSKIKVHYKMKVVGGENIASSGEDRTKPFEFRLGRWPSEATHGWDKAISSMHRGEVATLICGPQYAFGAAGAPPRIPPNATVETRLELEGWLDLAAEYNAVPGKVETDEELRERWSEDLADGTSPMKDEAGLNKKLQAEMSAKASTTPENTDHRGKKIYDLESKEAREIMAKQKVQGYTPDFGYVERANYLDLYIPVPSGTRAKDVTVEIHPDRMVVVVKGTGVVTQGHFQGKVALDGCYWLMSDLSLDPPGSTALGTQDDEVRQGPVYRGETCVQVFLEKRKPFDTLWENVYRPREGGD